MRSRLVVVFIVLAIIVGAATWWPVRTYYGFCHATGRYVPDAEKIDSAIDAVLASYPPPLAVYKLEGGVRRHVDNRLPSNPIRYGSREEFLRFNPSCCTLTNAERKGSGVTFWSRVTGSNSTFVVVRYQVRYRNDDGNVVSTPAEYITAIDNCGYAWSGH